MTSGEFSRLATDRLRETTIAGTVARYAYDGPNLIGEYNGSNAILRRYVHGPGVDEPLVSYAGSGTLRPSWLSADPGGSIVAMTDASGFAVRRDMSAKFPNGAWGLRGR